MALITTPSAEDANSYVTIEEADGYLSGNKTWEELGDTEKENALKLATMQIDTLRFFGRKVDSKQALSFPRILEDEDGDEYSQTVIIEKVKMATCEQVAHNLSGDGKQMLQMQSFGVKSYSIGDLSQSFGDKPLGDLYIASTARSIMKGLISRIGRVTNY